MLRSTRDSDEDVEPKPGRRTRTLTTQSVVDSPIRRSSRIKQSAKLLKYSPGSESDTSISSNQPVRTTRQRTATMDSITTETLKGHRVRKLSISSEASETVDIDVGTPSKRTTRRSLTTVTYSTPTRVSTRVTASKRFVRAGSETKSSPLSSRTTRRTRSSSVDPEIMFDQSKSKSTKIRKRASVLPSQSPVKEEIEDRQHKSGVKTDILNEIEEFTSSGNDSSLEVACSKENQKVKEIDDINKDKVEEDNSNNKVQNNCVGVCEIQMDDKLIDDVNAKKNTKGNEFSTIESEERLIDIENSLIEICKKSPTKELTVRLENIFETSIEGQKRSLSNKENQTLNIINDTSAEKNIGPIITNVTSLNTKSLTTVFPNKSLNEKEIKFMRNESNLDKRCYSRESTETAMKHIAILKENTDSIEEILDSSTDPLNPILIHKKKSLDSSLTDDITKKQSLVHDVDKKSTTMHDTTVKPVSSPVNDTELVEEIIDDHVFVETLHQTDKNATEIINKLNKSVTNTETCNKTIDSRESSCSLTANDNNEIILELENSNSSQNKNESFNKSMKTMVESNVYNSNESIDVETCDDKSIAVDKLASIIQDEARDNLLDSTRNIKNLSNHITQSTSESSSIILETTNLSSNNLNTGNVIIQDMQSSGDVMEISEKSTADMPFEKAESMNTSLEITMISTQQENKDVSAMSVGTKSTQLDQENMEDKGRKNLENMEIDDDISDVDIVSVCQDIPADEWKKDTVETKKAVEDEFNPVSMENESEAEYDLVLVDKQAWLAAENIKAVRDKECFEYDSDDTVLLKSRLDTTKTSNKKGLSTINEALLINIDDDDEEEEEEEEKERENEAAELIKTLKLSIKGKSTSEKDEDSSSVYIDVDSSTPNINSKHNDKFLNKSGKVLNRSSNQSASRLNKSEQIVEESVKILDQSDDETRGDVDRLNRNLQTRKNVSLRKSSGKRESLSKSSKRSSQSTQNNFVNKSQADNSEEELNNIETHTKRNLNKKKRSLDKSMKRNDDADIDEVESESKKNSSSEESGKEDKDKSINIEDYDENDTRNKDLRYKKNNLNYSTLALVGSTSSKSSDNTTEDSFKYSECISSLFELDSDTNDKDNDGISSTDSDIKREYNLDAVEQEYSDDNVPYDECRTSESEFSDPDDTGSDLADFIVADDAIEGEKNEEEEREEQNDENDGQEREEDEAAEQKEVENKDVDDEQVENAKEENNSIHAEDEEEKSIRTETNINKNDASDKSLKIGKNKRKISTEHIMADQPKRKGDIKVKKSHTKELEETNILDTSGSKLSIKKKRKSYVEETEQNSMKQVNENESIINRKLSKTTHTSVECSTPKINSKKEFATALEALETADEKSNSMNETTQRKKRKSKDSILKEDFSLKEPKRTNNKEKLLHTSLPSDLLERVGKMRPMSKTIELNKTVNVTYTETPTIRDLRKEKLNESAPELKLKAEINQLHKRRLSKEESNVAQKKTDEMDSDEEVPNLIALFNDNVQEHTNQRKQKKRKRQEEETSNENITEHAVSQESDISKQQKKKKKKKEKSNELSQILTVEDTIRKDTCQLVEKKKKKKINVTDENAKEDNVQSVRKKEKETLHTVQDETQYNKKKQKKKEQIVECDNISPIENIMIAKKKAKQPEIEDNKETLPKELSKKKKKEKKQKEMKEEKKIPSLQTEVSKFKSKSAKKMELEELQLQNVFLSKTLESKNVAVIKARNEALEAIKSATERTKLNKKLKKKQEDNANTIREQNEKVPIKRKKIEKHFKIEQKQILLSSTGGLKRLSDNVIDKLSDVQTRVKRRKLSQNTEQVMPSLSMKDSKFLETKMKNKNFIPLSSSGSTTQFAIVNISKIKKQPSKTITSVMSYRQHMLNRNSREPISSYLMYLRKQRAVQNSTKKFSDNAF